MLKREKEKIKTKNDEKLRQLEIETRDQLQNELDSKVSKLIEIKDKEIKVKYKRQLEMDKKSLEAKTKQNYDSMISKEMKKLEAERNEFARQKSAYSVMVHQFEVQQKEMVHKLKDKEIRLVKKQAEIKNNMKYIGGSSADLKPVETFARTEIANPYSVKEGMYRGYENVQVPQTEAASKIEKRESSSPFRSIRQPHSYYNPTKQSDNPNERSPYNNKKNTERNTLLPFSRALVYKAINEIGIDQMLNQMSLSPSPYSKKDNNTNNVSRGNFLISDRKEIDELPDVAIGERKYL